MLRFVSNLKAQDNQSIQSLSQCFVFFCASAQQIKQTVKVLVPLGLNQFSLYGKKVDLDRSSQVLDIGSGSLNLIACRMNPINNNFETVAHIVKFIETVHTQYHIRLFNICDHTHMMALAIKTLKGSAISEASYYDLSEFFVVLQSVVFNHESVVQASDSHELFVDNIVKKNSTLVPASQVASSFQAINKILTRPNKDLCDVEYNHELVSLVIHAVYCFVFYNSNFIPLSTSHDNDEPLTFSQAELKQLANQLKQNTQAFKLFTSLVKQKRSNKKHDSKLLDTQG